MVVDELAHHLDNNTSLTAGTNLFAVEMPPDPDTCVSLHEYDGTGPQDSFGSFSVYEDSRLQVRVRAATYPDAMALAQTVNSVLYLISDATIGGHRYHRVRQRNVWTVADIDTKSRVTVKCEYEVIRVP